MSAAVVWLFLLLAGATRSTQWRLVHHDGSVVAAVGAPDDLHLAAAELARLRVAWAWSAQRAPRPLTPASLSLLAATAPPPADRARLEVRVTRPLNLPPPPDLRVIAAPVEMWQDVPEGSLPSWPVPAGGRLLLPVDGRHRWRVRVAGTNEGSFWADVQPSQPAVAVGSRPAPGFDVAIADERGRPLGTVGGLVREGPARLRLARLWAGLRGSGRLGAPGLPDGQEISLDVIVPGYAPAAVRGWPSTLPRELRLRPGATLSGRVTDAAQRPLAGVEVSVETWARSGEAVLLHLKATTGAGGEWSVRAVPEGRAALTLRKAGFVPSVEQLTVAPGATDLGRRQLDRGARLAVLLRDAAGPVPGARVEAGPGLAAVAGVAGADGVAVLEAVPASSLTLRASADRHEPASLRLNPPFPPQAVLTLPQAFTVTGRFLDGAGAAVAGGSAQVVMPSCNNRTRLADDGTFSLSLVAGKPATMVLHGPRVRELRQDLAPGEPGEVRDLGDLRAPPGIDVTGRVLSAQDATPVTGAHVWLPRPGGAGPTLAWANGDLLETTTGETGVFRLSGLAPGAARLRIDAAGFARAQADVTVDDPAPAGAIDLGDLPIAPGTRLHVLVHPSGRPSDADLEGATARVDLNGQWSDPDMLQAEVHGGEAVVPNVPPGRATVSVLAGRALVCDRQVAVTGEAPEMDIDCARKTMTVTGTVRLGNSPAGAGNLVWRAAGPGAAPAGDSQVESVDSPAGLRQQQVFGLGRPQVDTAVDGGSQFVTQDLSSGLWSVAWTARAGTLSSPVTVEIPEADSFATALVFPGLTVSGAVTTRDGRPAAGARVRELASGNLTAAGDDGTFVLAGLPPGPATLQAQQGDLLSRPLRLDLPADGSGTDPVQLVVGDDAASLKVQVVSASGAPVGGAFVFLEEQGAGIRLLTTGADGTASAGLEGGAPAAVRIAAYAAGVWTLGAWTPWDTAQQGLALESDGAGRGTLVISSTQPAAVRLVSADGWDLSFLHQILGAPLQVLPTKPLELQGLPAGTYTVSGGSGAAVTLSVSGQAVSGARLDG